MFWVIVSPIVTMMLLPMATTFCMEDVMSGNLLVISLVMSHTGYNILHSGLNAEYRVDGVVNIVADATDILDGVNCDNKGEDMLP